MVRNKYKWKMEVQNEVRSSFQVLGILADEIKIKPSLEIREEVIAWQRFQFTGIYSY